MSTFTDTLYTQLAYDDAVAKAQAAYEKAKAADLAFYTECVRQFGHAAPDMRYLSTAHDKQTAEARDAYRLATERMHQAQRAVAKLAASQTNSQIPVVYTLSPIGVDGTLEATGVIFFCSDKCRDIALIERRVESDGPIALGMSSEFCDGTKCDECGKQVSR